MPNRFEPPLSLRRAEAQAILSAFGTVNARLFASPNITLVMESLCGGATRARHFDSPPPTPTAEQAARLELRAGERIRYRHTFLLYGDHALIEAENWYRPDRLTPEMNRLLDETDTPFEKVVSPLLPRRRTLGTKLLWPPLAALSVDRPTELPREVLEHRALFTTPDNKPFSEIWERYRVDLVDAMTARSVRADAALRPERN